MTAPGSRFASGFPAALLPRGDAIKLGLDLARFRDQFLGLLPRQAFPGLGENLGQFPTLLLQVHPTTSC